MPRKRKIVTPKVLAEAEAVAGDAWNEGVEERAKRTAEFAAWLFKLIEPFPMPMQDAYIQLFGTQIDTHDFAVRAACGDIEVAVRQLPPPVRKALAAYLVHAAAYWDAQERGEGGVA